MHLKVSVSTDDDLITRAIKTARQFVEEYTGLQLMKATWTLYLDDFKDKMYLNKAPILSLSSIKYYNTSNELTTLDSSYYDADVISEPARIVEAEGYAFPTADDRLNAVQIEFVCGYSDSATEAVQQAAVPSIIKDAMLLLIEHNYDNRGDEGHRVYPKAIYDLLDKVRLFWL